MRALLLVLLVACGKSGPSEDVLVTSKARFTKMLAAFDTNVATCTTKPKKKDVAMFRWSSFLYGTGEKDPKGDNDYWGEDNDIASRFANSYNPKSSQIEYASAVAKLPVVAIKVTKLENAKIGLDTYTAGTIEARAVQFDLTGTPTCSFTITAKNSEKVWAEAQGTLPGYEHSTDEQKRKALDEDLDKNFKSAVASAFN